MDKFFKISLGIALIVVSVSIFYVALCQRYTPLPHEIEGLYGGTVLDRLTGNIIQ